LFGELTRKLGCCSYDDANGPADTLPENCLDFATRCKYVNIETIS